MVSLGCCSGSCLSAAPQCQPQPHTDPTAKDPHAQKGSDCAGNVLTDKQLDTLIYPDVDFWPLKTVWALKIKINRRG